MCVCLSDVLCACTYYYETAAAGQLNQYKMTLGNIIGNIEYYYIIIINQTEKQIFT